MGTVASCCKPPLEETLARARRYREQELRVLGLTPETLQAQANDLLKEVAVEVAEEKKLAEQMFALRLPNVPSSS